MTDTWDEDREELEESEEVNLLGHDPVLGPSDEEADVHGDNLSRVDEDQLGDDDDVFTEEPDALWSRVLARQGGPLALLATMPPDPSLN